LDFVEKLIFTFCRVLTSKRFCGYNSKSPIESVGPNDKIFFNRLILVKLLEKYQEAQLLLGWPTHGTKSILRGQGHRMKLSVR
jgi:hypothetical protein